MHPCLRTSPSTPPSPGPALTSWEFFQFWKLLSLPGLPQLTESVVQVFLPTLVHHILQPWGKVKKAQGWQWKRPGASEDLESGVRELGSPPPSRGGVHGAVELGGVHLLS